MQDVAGKTYAIKKVDVTSCTATTTVTGPTARNLLLYVAPTALRDTKPTNCVNGDYFLLDSYCLA